MVGDHRISRPVANRRFQRSRRAPSQGARPCPPSTWRRRALVSEHPSRQYGDAGTSEIDSAWIQANLSPIRLRFRHTAMQRWVTRWKVRSKSGGSGCTLSGSTRPAPAGERSRTVQMTMEYGSSRQITACVVSGSREYIRRSGPTYIETKSTVAPQRQSCCSRPIEQVRYF